MAIPTILIKSAQNRWHWDGIGNRIQHPAQLHGDMRSRMLIWDDVISTPSPPPPPFQNTNKKITSWMSGAWTTKEVLETVCFCLPFTHLCICCSHLNLWLESFCFSNYFTDYFIWGSFIWKQNNLILFSYDMMCLRDLWNAHWSLHHRLSVIKSHLFFLEYNKLSLFWRPWTKVAVKLSM